MDRPFGHNGYRNVSLQDQTDQATKYKLKGTICTNGLVCHLLAYDTSVLRPKAARENSQEDDNEDMDQRDLETLKSTMDSSKSQTTPRSRMVLSTMNLEIMTTPKLHHQLIQPN